MEYGLLSTRLEDGTVVEKARNIMKVIAVLLIVAGLVGLAYGGFSFTHKDKILEVGSVEVTQDKTETFPIPPIAGGLLLVAGVVLLVRSGSTS